MEKLQDEHAYGNIGVSQVEYGAEEHEEITSPDRNPLRQKAFVKRKIEHIYHLAM